MHQQSMQKSHKEVVQSPAFVVLPVFELVAEVGVANDVWVSVPPDICEAPTYQMLTERVPFLLYSESMCSHASCTELTAVVL